MKKLIAFTLSALLLCSLCTAFAAGDGAAGAAVQVRIEDCDKNLFFGPVAYTQGMTALEAALTALRQAGLEAATSDSPYGGKYIYSIGDRKEGAFGGYEGWMYYVDGQSPMYNIADCLLEPGQQLLVAFADMSVLLPLVEARRTGDTVTVTVSADVTSYDAQWNATVTRQPVAGVTVTADGGAYTTDEAGQITLSAESAQKERITLQAEKYGDNGLPLLLRLEPGFVLDIPQKAPLFTDVPSDADYAAAVEKLAEAGVVTGYGAGLFGPGRTVTRGELAVMLYRMAGSLPAQGALTFSDALEGQWYTDAVRWAADKGIFKGYDDGTVRPAAGVSRQEMAVMVLRYAQNVAGITLPDTGEAPAFADNGDIAPYAAEAVYLLQKAGMVTGDSFRPGQAALRQEVAALLGQLLK